MLKVILILFAILLVGLIVALSLWFHPILIHASQETGTSNSASRAYDFWSGFGSDIGEVALLGALVAGVRHLNCHNKGCWRLAIHTTANGHKFCKKCIGRPNEELETHNVHPDHR